METVQFLASVAEIWGGIAVVLAISFGFVEFRRYKANERREAGATLARSYQTPELAATLRIVVELPEPIPCGLLNSNLFKRLELVVPETDLSFSGKSCPMS